MKIFARALFAAMLVANMAAISQPSVLGPYSDASNISADILGEPDKRPSTWGLTGYTVNTLEFKPPAGYRVRILRMYGNVNVTPKVPDPETQQLPAGSRASYLHGFQTTAPEGSTRMVPAASNTLTYYQGDVSEKVDKDHLEFNVDVSAGGLLEKDNKLYSKFATFLNTMGVALHLEVSWVTIYEFRKMP